MGKIIAFAGSTSSTSINQQFINSVVKLIDNNEVEVLDLRDYRTDLFEVDKLKEGVPEIIQNLKAKMETADGFLISTPEHNGSMTAAFKSTLDWLSMMDQKIFGEKPTVFTSVSPGPRGGVSALEHLVAIMPFRGAKVVGSYSLGSFEEHFKDGVLSDEKLGEVKGVIQKLEEAIS